MLKYTYIVITAGKFGTAEALQAENGKTAVFDTQEEAETAGRKVILGSKWDSYYRVAQIVGGRDIIFTHQEPTFEVRPLD